MRVNRVNKEDLRKFKTELLGNIKNLLISKFQSGNYGCAHQRSENF